MKTGKGKRTEKERGSGAVPGVPRDQLPVSATSTVANGDLNM